MQILGQKNFAHQIMHIINQWNVKYFNKQPKKVP